MKIGVLTFFGGTNYGTVFQALALCEYLKQSGHEAEVIRYYDNHLIGQEKRERKKLSVQKVEQKLNQCFFRWALRRNIEKRKALFSRFRETEVPHSKEYYRADNIGETIGTYDCYICGSDQVWTPWNGGLDPVYWLEFVPDQYLKLSYAPSMANVEYSIEAQKAIREFAKRLDAISVRETKGKEFLEMLGVKNVVKVLDPTLLLPGEWWNEYLKKQEHTENEVKKDYIFAFFLGANTKQRKIVAAFSRAVGLPIVTYPCQDKFVIKDFSFGDVRRSAQRPEDFLYEIKKARYVFTDSFHVAVFSLIFEKEFWVFRKFADDDKASQNARIYDLLAMADCSHRLLTNRISADEILKTEPIDYHLARKNIENERQCSIHFLRGALDRKNERCLD